MIKEENCDTRTQRATVHAADKKCESNLMPSLADII